MKRPDYAKVTSRSLKPRHWLISRICARWKDRGEKPVLFVCGANVSAWAYTGLQQDHKAASTASSRC